MSRPSSALRGDRDPHVYRDNVGIALFSRRGLVFVGHRAQVTDSQSWQMPQGGIDPGETPQVAAYRELAEETGVRAEQTEYLDQTDGWYYYDFSPEVKARLGGPYRGQRQRWFAFAFRGTPADIAIDQQQPAEFDAWKWAPLSDVPVLVVPFKRDVYDVVCARFARYSAGCDGGVSESGRAMA